LTTLPPSRHEPPTRHGAIRPRSPAERLEPSRPPGPPRGAPPPNAPKRGAGFIRFLSAVFTIAVFVVLAAGAVAALLYHEYEEPGPLAVARVVTIPKGEGRIEIASRLEKEGAISSRWAFIANYLLRNALGTKQVELKAGDYEIKKGASMAEITAMLSAGRGVLSKVTIPEGLTSMQIVERLRQEAELAGDVTDIPPEGSLLPDTYRFSKGMERHELLERMQNEMQKFLSAAWERRQQNLPFSTPEEAIIFASIVEKETGRADERGRVAAVFANRMRKGMRLQSDPTVIYGIAGGQGTLGRSITRADLDTKTSHNTYQIPGLPPTPICNPGRSAIEASLNPPATTDLYFVADGTGGHTFSDTLKEHNAAVSTWRKVEKERKKEAEGPTAASQQAIPVINATPPPAAAPSAKATAGASAVPLPVRKPKP
jgi:UPF0755 protein